MDYAVRAALVAVTLLTLGADYPWHRRFAQRCLSGGSVAVAGASCTPATGGPLVSANWVSFTNAAAVTRTANYPGVTDPGCGVAYERLQIPATTAAEFSTIQNPTGTLCPAGISPISMGCWVRGVSGSGTTDFSTEQSGYTAHDLPFSTTPYFFKLENVALPGGGATVMIGGLSAVTGVARSAADILVWGCRCAAGTTISQ